MKMASLSIYKGILNRTVPQALYRLLWAENEEAFLRAWGELFAALCERGYSDNLTGCLTEAALFDENAFSLTAAAGREVSPAMRGAAGRDLRVILELGSLSAQDVLDDGPQGADSLSLPVWGAGEPVEQLRGEGSLAERLERYYRENGCGMYARYRAFIWRDHAIHPVVHPDPTTLRDLKGYEIQRRMAIDNTVSFLVGLPANNCLLYGDRGTGKSSTVKAILNEYYTRGLRVIEMPKESLMDFPRLVDEIAALPM